VRADSDTPSARTADIFHPFSAKSHLSSCVSFSSFYYINTEKPVFVTVFLKKTAFLSLFGLLALTGSLEFLWYLHPVLLIAAVIIAFRLR
jgi:hypothetical protein